MRQFSISEEERERLKAFTGGPWKRIGERARRSVAPGRPAAIWARKDGRVDLEEFRRHLPARIRRQEEKIKDDLKVDWFREFSEEEVALRESFDEALTPLQLLELAISTGYVSVESARLLARRLLIELLWPKCVRKYVEGYDYIGVRILAERVGIDLGLKSIRPPKARSGAEIRFAEFLEILRSWYDAEVDDWLGTLDGVGIVEGDYYEQEAFYELLEDGVLPDECTLEEVYRYLDLAKGAHEFLATLGRLFRSLRRSERPHYGTFFLYWLAAFFGHAKSGRSYAQDDDLYNWAAPIRRDPELLAFAVGGPAFRNGKAYARYVAAVRREIDLLREVWEGVRQLVRNATAVRPDRGQLRSDRF